MRGIAEFITNVASGGGGTAEFITNVASGEGGIADTVTLRPRCGPYKQSIKNVNCLANDLSDKCNFYKVIIQVK